MATIEKSEGKMSRNINQKSKRAGLRVLTAVLVWAFIITSIYSPMRTAKAGATSKATGDLSLYRRPAPQYDLNAARALQNMRAPAAAQLEALNNLKTASGSPNLTARWNEFGGSV